MSAAIVTLASQIGAPIIRDILSRKLGAQNGALAADVLERIAMRAGVPVEEVDAAPTDTLKAAIQDVERESPELLALYAQGLEGQFALLQAEAADPAWMRAWRPGGMYLIGFLWLWNVVILHVSNAAWKIALPPVPFEQLIQLSALYFGLYMGGHTVKDVVAQWAAKGGAK